MEYFAAFVMLCFCTTVKKYLKTLISIQCSRSEKYMLIQCIIAYLCPKSNFFGDNTPTLITYSKKQLNKKGHNKIPDEGISIQSHSLLNFGIIPIYNTAPKSAQFQ